VTTRVQTFTDAAAQALADEARPALGARVVSISKLQPDLMLVSLAWSVEPGARYERALAAAKKIMPSIDPAAFTVRVDVNTFTSNVHLLGMTMLDRFDEAARYTVHPMVAGFASKILEMRWTLSIPMRVGPRIVGSFSAHFPERPSDMQQALAHTFAERAAATLGAAGTFA
jgi:hypothetical protein